MICKINFERRIILRINSSQVGMESARTYRSESTRTLRSSLNIAKGGSKDFFDSTETLSLMQSEFQNSMAEYPSTSSSSNPTQVFQQLSNTAHATNNRLQELQKGSTQKAIEQIRYECVYHLWQIFFGKEKANELSKNYQLSLKPLKEDFSNQHSSQTIALSINEKNSFEESESISFHSEGTVIDATGKEINFQIEVNMSRNFKTYYEENREEEITLCDPLVIQIENSIIGLSDQKFSFDLNNDGNKEEISNLKKGSGFLAIDKNQDGIINDGSELFGSQSGDGFADLSLYDEDQDGWIDEDDSVYEKLQIWIRNEDGTDSLYHLKEKAIGAIYLASSETDFTMRSEESNKINGVLRKTGVFLYENGNAGTLCHLDLAN